MNDFNNSKNLRELNTPFGKLYIEPWEWHFDNMYPYDDAERITIYDSRGDWLDYFSLDYFYDSYDATDKDYANEEEYAQAQYNNLCEMLELGAEKKTLEEFIDWFGVQFYYAGPDKHEAAMALSEGNPEELAPDELETNEYVNHIGGNYIVVAEI